MIFSQSQLHYSYNLWKCVWENAANPRKLTSSRISNSVCTCIMFMLGNDSFFSLLPLFPTQWLLPAPLSAPQSHPPSLLRSCPLLAKTVNAPSASIRRSTRSSTPAATCVCATTAGWSWRDRSTPAAPYAGGPLKTLSKHIGRDHPPFAPTHVQPGAVSSTDRRCRFLFSG